MRDCDRSIYNTVRFHGDLCFTSQTVAETRFPHHNSRLHIRSLVVIFEKIFPILLPLTKLLAPQTTLLSGVITLEGDECFRADCGDLFLVPLRIVHRIGGNLANCEVLNGRVQQLRNWARSLAVLSKITAAVMIWVFTPHIRCTLAHTCSIIPRYFTSVQRTNRLPATPVESIANTVSTGTSGRLLLMSRSLRIDDSCGFSKYADIVLKIIRLSRKPRS